MAALAKKPKAAAKATKPKPKPKRVAAPVKKPVRAKAVVQMKTKTRVETLPQIAPVADDAVMTVANEAVMTHAPEMALVMDAMPYATAAANDERILLPARMELASLEEAHQLLQSKYPPVSNKYILDGGLLSVIDSAGVQMLISFIRSMTAKGCTVEWDNYSVQVYQLASELGVTSQLGD